ncbi:hypothetical protein KC19_7G011700 [Ceratodon purpureus]|uniref:Carboxypeptidase n=1 Tax=Ceratodon purpureus TaxID=3225 RepID=A0A8T0H5T4_CERPU|nr:hypothetical protein KC19_7G011700 [Ceratodon purpureus]
MELRGELGSSRTWFWLVALLFAYASFTVKSVESTNQLKDEFVQRAADRVKWLPGQPASFTFRQYAGYVNVEGDIGRHLFYYLAESPKNCSGKPLVLWLNGGPGCSSMGNGWAEELGPFHITENGTGLVLNTKSWIRYANLLFLDSPTGVGYSYSDNPEENHSGGDARTAEDSYTFLIRWLERFPEYKTRDFYITGESYAGHYIPQLAALIHERNKDAELKINLKGIMVGNPSTDNYYDSIGAIDYWLSHAMISPKTHDDLHRACNFTDPNCCSQECNDKYYYANQVEIGGIDSYNVNSPSCPSADDGAPQKRRRLTQSSRSKNPVHVKPCFLFQFQFDLLAYIGARNQRTNYEGGYLCVYQTLGEKRSLSDRLNVGCSFCEW